MKYHLSGLFRYWVAAGIIALLSVGPVNAATLQLDFDISFGDPLDPDTAPPDGAGPWMTAVFDDGDTVGSVTLTLSVAGTVGGAEVTEVYLNVDDAIGAGNLTINSTGGSGPAAGTSHQTGTDAFKADADGWYDILFSMPNNTDTFDGGETLTFDITATGLVASSFNFLSTPDPVDPNGPFLGAAKFASTSGCVTGPGQCSDWVGAVPVPAAAWLFGSGLLVLVGMAKRKKA